MLALVIVSGQMWPLSAWVAMNSRAARAAWPDAINEGARAPSQIEQCRPAAMPRAISA